MEWRGLLQQTVLLFSEIQQLGQPTHLNARVVLRNYTDVVLNDALAQLIPAVLCVFRDCVVEHVCGAEVWAEMLLYFGPAHQLMHGEELEELGLDGDLSVAGVGLYAVDEIGLLVVVRC